LQKARELLLCRWSLRPQNEFLETALKRSCSGVRYGMVLLARAATHSDCAHDSAITLQGDTSGKDHNLAVVRGVNPKKLAA